MRKILLLLLIFIGICALWSLPLYLCVNFVLWLFHISFHLTWLQAFGLCLLSTLLNKLLFKGDKK